MCCRKPGCEKTFMKYMLIKGGLLTGANRENIAECTNTFLKYYVDKRRGRTHWNQPRKYCHEHRMSGQTGENNHNWKDDSLG